MGDNIRDILTEFFLLKKPQILMAEYIPCGINQMVNLNKKLGSVQRVKGSLLTSVMDEAPDEATFVSNSIYTSVWVDEFNLTDFVKFKANIRIPEEEGIIQEENFGVLINADGSVFYGCDLLDVNGQDTTQNFVSLDKIARVFSDLVQDSSTLMSTILSNFQNQILQFIYNNHDQDRNKFVVLMSDDYSLPLNEGKPMTATDFQDGEDYENEINQILSDFLKAVDLPGGGLCFLGSEGMILISKDSRKYEMLVGNFIKITSMDLFLDNFFRKVWFLMDLLKEISERILSMVELNAKLISQIQSRLSAISSEVILFNSIIPVLLNSILSFKTRVEKLKNDPILEKMYAFLEVDSYFINIERRVNDIGDLMNSLEKEAESVHEIFLSLSERQMRHLTETTQESIRSLENIAKTGDRQNATLNIIEIILSGSVAFDLVATLFNEPASIDIATALGINQIAANTILFAIGTMMWVGIAFGIFRFMKALEGKVRKFLRVNIKINGACNVKFLNEYLVSKHVEVLTTQEDVTTSLRMVEWVEKGGKWGKNEVQLRMRFDMKNKFLETISAEIVGPQNLNRTSVIKLILEELIEKDIIPPRELEEVL
ncbi:MAG: hypothetical protein ACTSUE_00100 [Promethearchaeota archaeon]